MIRHLLIPAFAIAIGQFAIAAASIPFTEAGNHVGEEQTVSGKVSSVRLLPSGMGFVNFGNRAFTAVARPGTFAAGKLEEFIDKDVEVTGTIELYKDSPQIVLKAPDSIRIAGAPAAPPETVEAAKPAEAGFKVTELEIDLDRSEIREAGKTESGFIPTKTKIAIALPTGFKPTASQCILAVFPDFSGENDLVKMIGYYAKPATARGWVVVTAHSASTSNSMPPGWYAAMTRAAVRHLATDFPGAAEWPLFLAGSSEGASRASLSLGALINEGSHVGGCFLNSLKREEIRKSIREFDPSKTRLKRVKVFISHGEQDTFVTKRESMDQAEIIRQAEIRDVRHELHPGRGWVDAQELSKALAWFEEGETP